MLKSNIINLSTRTDMKIIDWEMNRMCNSGEVYGEIRLSIRRNTSQTDECSVILESESAISEELILELIKDKLKSIGLEIHNCDIEFNRLFVDDEF